MKRTSIKIRRQHIKKKRDSQAATQYNSNHAFLPFICAFLVAFRWEAAPKPARGSLDSMRKKIRVPKILAPEDDLRLARARDLSIFCLSHRRLSSVFFPLSPPLLAIWSVHILARSPELYTRDAISISSPPLIRRASRQIRAGIAYANQSYRLLWLLSSYVQYVLHSSIRFERSLSIIIRHDSLAILIFAGAGEGKSLLSSDDLGILARMLPPNNLSPAPASLPFLGV